MRVSGEVCLLVLAICVPSFANSIRRKTLASSCVSCSSRLPSASAVLIRSDHSRPEPQTRIVLAEPDSFSLMTVGVLAIIFTAGHWKTRTSHGPDCFWQKRRGSVFSEVQMHIIRSLLLGLSDDSISATLHLKPLTFRRNLAELMRLAEANTREDLVKVLLLDPKFQQWVQFVSATGVAVQATVHLD